MLNRNMSTLSKERKGIRQLYKSHSRMSSYEFRESAEHLDTTLIKSYRKSHSYSARIFNILFPFRILHVSSPPVRSNNKIYNFSPRSSLLRYVIGKIDRWLIVQARKKKRDKTSCASASIFSRSLFLVRSSRLVTSRNVLYVRLTNIYLS